jgi:hypothetical protein
VPARPSPAQRAIIAELVDLASATIVMSHAAAAEMTRSYGVPADRLLDIVPHGVPHLPQVAADTIKPRLGLQGRAVILSFGLLEPGKGCEAVIDAMPAVVKACRRPLRDPGRDRTESAARDGDTYTGPASRPGLPHAAWQNVKFVDRFVGRVELGNWLEAADVITTPYPDLDRTVAATLSFAMAAGKPIVSTPYAYATRDARRRTAAGSSRRLAGSAGSRVHRAAGRSRSPGLDGQRAYEYSRGMVWWEVGSQYRRIFDRVTSAAVSRPRLTVSQVRGGHCSLPPRPRCAFRARLDRVVP